MGKRYNIISVSTTYTKVDVMAAFKRGHHSPSNVRIKNPPTANYEFSDYTLCLICGCNLESSSRHVSCYFTLSRTILRFKAQMGVCTDG